MDKMNSTLHTEASTQAFAKDLALFVSSPLVLTFTGEIGAGKTTLIRALLRALGVVGPIKSPTFSLVESYQVATMEIHHFDLYRIDEEEELEHMGFREYFSPHSLCCIEWPERGGRYMKQVDLDFALSINGSGRLMQITAKSLAGETILRNLKGAA